ncbi:MAG: class I SAM-dependent methyltransferase [Anaerolineales bacterium]|jgi:C-methyltransferase
MTASAPNSDPIYGLYGGGFMGQFTRLALQLDLFTALASGPKSATQVAQACQADTFGVQALLEFLSSTQVLTFDSQSSEFALTPSAAAFLVPTSPTYAGDWVLANTDPALWSQMLETIRSGATDGYNLPWAQDAWLESYSPSRVAYSLSLWKTIGVDIQPEQPFRILDLACGCGIKTLALAQAYPSVEVTCVDSPQVLDVARHLAERFNIVDKTTFTPADILHDDFGQEKYQAALLGLITYIFTPRQNLEAFRRAYQALQPQGTLVIDAIMASKTPSEWASRATLLMHTWNGGAAHSFEQYADWLKQVGFKRVIRHSDQLLSAIK